MILITPHRPRNASAPACLGSIHISFHAPVIPIALAVRGPSRFLRLSLLLIISRRSLGDFLGLGPTDPVPNHSCVSKTHKRLPEEVFNEVFRFILSVAAHKGLLWGKAIGIDSTTIQANASMRSIVRKDSGKGWGV